jgi:hypothetical protein
VALPLRLAEEVAGTAERSGQAGSREACPCSPHWASCCSASNGSGRRPDHPRRRAADPALGDWTTAADGATVVRLYEKPLVLLIWLGAVVMMLVGALPFSDRRLRVGAPTRSRSRVALQPAE